MRKLFIVIIIMTAGVCYGQKNNRINYPFNYCKYLGFDVRQSEEKNSWVCTLPNGKEVDLFDFYYGLVGQEYSYCARKGYKTKQLTIKKGLNSLRYPVCYKDGEKEKHLHQLMYEYGDYYDMFLDPTGAPPPDSIPDPGDLPNPPPPEPLDPGFDSFF